MTDAVMTDAVVGRREHKRQRTQLAIRQGALALFREQGYGATTVEQIAAAAGISPSTFFRHFPTKESIVGEGRYSALVAQAFDDQPDGVPVVEGVHRAIRAVVDSLSESQLAALRERTALTTGTPELRAAMIEHLFDLMSTISESAAERLGEGTSELELRSYAWMAHGVAAAAWLHWIEHEDASLGESFDVAFAVLRRAATL